MTKLMSACSRRKELSCGLMKNLYSILSVIIVSAVVSCSSPEAPEYLGFRDFSIQNVSMDSALLHTQLAFYNPNTFNMELKRGDVSVFLDDQLANHYVMDTTISIPKKDIARRCRRSNYGDVPGTVESASCGLKATSRERCFGCQTWKRKA